MEPRRRALRPMAVINAVVLVGVFIWFFSNAVFMLGSKAGTTFQPVPTTKSGPVPPQEQPFLSGSKSTFIFTGNSIKPPVRTEQAPAPHEPSSAPPIPLAD